MLRIGIWPALRNWQRLGSLPSTRVYWSRILRLNQGEWVTPLVYSQHKLDSVVGGGAQGQWIIYSIYGVFKQKTKRNLSESDSENEAAGFPRFIVIESLEEVCLPKFSPFRIEKVISTRASAKTVKKTRNGNLLVEGDNGVIRSRELALATEDGITSALGKQGVTNIKRISIRKCDERIQTNTYILTFNKPQTPKQVKISYCLERVEQYVPAPLRCFICQKFWHHREACRGRQTCSKCSEKDPDYAEEDCLKEIRCANCQQDHPAYARTCTVDQKEKEIIEVKHKRKCFLPGS